MADNSLQKTAKTAKGVERGVNLSAAYRAGRGANASMSAWM
jgi:hypothetical protein